MELNGHDIANDREVTRMKDNLLIWLVQQAGGRVAVSFTDLSDSVVGFALRMKAGDDGVEQLVFTVEDCRRDA